MKRRLTRLALSLGALSSITVLMILPTVLAQSFDITSFTLSPPTSANASFASSIDYNYVLYRRSGINLTDTIVAESHGTGAVLTLTDSNRPVQQAFYRVAAEGPLVVNEIDYDQPSTDGTEFVEIYNKGNVAVDLQDKALVFVNGADNNEYLRVSLAPAGSLPSHGYLVVCSNGVNPAPGALVIRFALAASNIQNGSPDGVALVDTFSNTLLDALSYAGSITAANINGFPAPVSLVEGTAFSGTDNNISTSSLVRFPDGTDSNDANSDWRLAGTPSPGGANLN